MKFLGEVDLKFEISDGQYLVKLLGKTFRLARKALEISGRILGQISEKISETSFQISHFFGNFLQQKGSANAYGSAFIRIGFACNTKWW